MIENIVIQDSAWIKQDLKTLFSDEEVAFSKSDNISVLMVELGIYPSSSKARAAGRHGPIPPGYTKFKASKKQFIYLWNPTE